MREWSNVATRRLRQCAFHVRSFEITVGAVAGWEIFEREDERVVCQQHYTDWHRVEHVAQRLSPVVADVQREGWQEQPA